MTLQEIFDKVAVHLLTQGCKSGQPNPAMGFQCLYRGPNGTQCAVGHLIKDEHYSPEMEEMCVAEEIVIQALIDSGVKCGPVTLNLLTDLQILHDGTPAEEWCEVLKVIAKKYKLDPYVIDMESV